MKFARSNVLYLIVVTMKLNPFTFSWCNPESQARRRLFNGKGPVKGRRTQNGVYILLDAKILNVQCQVRLYSETIDNTHIGEFDLQFIASQHEALGNNRIYIYVLHESYPSE
jgi:hypothetical protein